MNLFLPGLIDLATKVVYYMHIQNYHEGGIQFRALLNQIQQSDELCFRTKEILGDLLDALEGDDEILLADLLEEAFIPTVKEYIAESLDLSEVISHKEYSVELTSTGLFTVKHVPSGLYLHSNHNPMVEARTFVERCFDANHKEYVVWGCGLGYHILALYEMTRGAVPIRVFEDSKELLNLAGSKGVLPQIPSEVLTCVYDPAGREFASYINNNKVGILLHYPSIKKIEKKELRETLKDFFASWNGAIQYRDELVINFGKNTTICSNYLDELRQVFAGKEVVIIGGGPSLDEHIETLRALKGNCVLVAVTTVWEKLLKLQIKPDVVFVMDSQRRTFGHMSDIEDTQTPLVIDSTAYWEFAAKYRGPKYIACQQGFGDAEKLAEEKALLKYETGGSVVTLALDAVLKLGAVTVHFVGVDLAYPDGKSHAAGTMDASNRDTSSLTEVKAQDGTVTYTDKLFGMYRKWIEGKIREYPQVQFYNMARKGAYIEGTSLWKNR